MIELHNRSTKLVLARPDVATPYYRGTRFDRSGIILSLESRGRKYVSQWFREYDPFNHDAVGGPAEEFSPIGYDNADPGGGFLKPGVGLLERDVDEYDHFRLYKVLDEGERDFKAAPGQTEFRHRMAAGGYSYDYMKRIIIPREGTLVLEHILKNTGKGIMDMYVYNHNFFVLDGAPTGKATVITLPFKPQGFRNSGELQFQACEHRERPDRGCPFGRRDGIRRVLVQPRSRMPRTLYPPPHRARPPGGMEDRVPFRNHVTNAFLGANVAFCQKTFPE